MLLEAWIISSKYPVYHKEPCDRLWTSFNPDEKDFRYQDAFLKKLYDMLLIYMLLCL